MLGQLVERAVPQPDHAVLAAPRLISVPGQRSVQVRDPVQVRDSGPVRDPGPEPAAELGAQARGPGSAARQLPLGSDSTAWTSSRAASSYSRGGTVTANSRSDRV